jgi:hypothetical protein
MALSISDLPEIAGRYGESDDEQPYPSPSIFHRHLDTSKTRVTVWCDTRSISKKEKGGLAINRVKRKSAAERA